VGDFPRQLFGLAVAASPRITAAGGRADVLEVEPLTTIRQSRRTCSEQRNEHAADRLLQDSRHDASPA
jgi:hypothetical protein